MKQKYWNRIQNIGICCLLTVLTWSCAEPRAPEGGPKDTQAPRISKKRYSTPNPSTNFEDQMVILTFDEWVKLQNAYSQVIISPPLKKKPDVKIRNKSVVVKWKEPLKENTTYIINFGDAVSDITENNVVPDLKMVFSTGNQLDSLTCSGQIVDAFTKDPKADVWVMLYQNLADSMPLTQQPYYFTKTNEQGNFLIEYIKAGRYRIFALEDKNTDYIYNLPNESIAFLDSSFVIGGEVEPVLRLNMFQERPETIVKSYKMPHYGAVKVLFNNEVQTQSTIRLLDAPNDYESLVYQGADSLLLWFDGTMDTTAAWKFVVENKAEKLLDTIEIREPESKAYFKENGTTLRWFLPENSALAGRKATVVERPLQDTISIEQHPLKSVPLVFKRPVNQVDKDKVWIGIDSAITVIKTEIVEGQDPETGDAVMDTIETPILLDTFIEVSMDTLRIDADNQQKILVSSDWLANRSYKIIAFPNAVEDYWGIKNQDTLSRIYRINSEDAYGTIQATITGADKAEQYIIELVDDKKKVIDQSVVTDSTTIRLVYQQIKTAQYTVRVILDELPNGRLDVGSYKENRQAEKVIVSKVIGLNAGWENFMEIDLSKTRTVLPNVTKDREDKKDTDGK